MKSLTMLAAAAAASLALVAAPVAAQQRLDNTYSFIRIGDEQGGYVLGVKVFQDGDRAAICGLSFMLPRANGAIDNRLKRFGPEFNSQIVYSVAGRNLRFNARQFPFVNSEAEALLTDTRCIRTLNGWSPEMAGAEVEMNATSLSVRD